MDIDDDRTKEQKATHIFIVVGRDTFLSGWGRALGGVSLAAWACEAHHVDDVLAWVKRREDMRRVRTFLEPPGKRFRPRGKGHCHIYVVGESHPAIVARNAATSESK